MKLSFKVKSPANIALLKYWGQQDEQKVLPANVSVSFNLSNCYTSSEFIYGDLKDDSYEFDDDEKMAMDQIARVRDFFMKKGTLLPFVKVKSENSFPANCGIASSASSMSALTFGLFELAKRFGGNFQKADLIEMTRLRGSASAVRSLGSGIVVYNPDKSGEILELEDKFNLIDVTCLVSDVPKTINSQRGHVIAKSSDLFDERLKSVGDRFLELMDAYEDSDFEKFGEIVESEAISFLVNHYTADPRLQYLRDSSLDLIYKVKSLGLPVYFTFDAGCNPHFITADNINIDFGVFGESIKNMSSTTCQII